MLSHIEFARTILLGEELSEKLLAAEVEWQSHEDFPLPSKPGRTERLSFSPEQPKFPKAARLSETDKKALAIHSFANHELLAIEMMAAALLHYPHADEETLRFKRGVLGSLRDEQKHLSLYVSRLNELGYEFGDFPLNDFFWRQMDKLRTPQEYAAVMSLTFEAANLDFAAYYAGVFRSHGDLVTASILETVLEDEISHVAFGAAWMKRWSGVGDLWERYLNGLPWPLTPARSKGICFRPDLRERALGDRGFVENLINYDDGFRVTKRTPP